MPGAQVSPLPILQIDKYISIDKWHTLMYTCFLDSAFSVKHLTPGECKGAWPKGAAVHRANTFEVATLRGDFVVRGQGVQCQTETQRFD